MKQTFDLRQQKKFHNCVKSQKKSHVFALHHNSVNALYIYQSICKSISLSLGSTALHYATEYGHHATVEVLITNGASLHDKNDRGNNLIKLSHFSIFLSIYHYKKKLMVKI